MLVGTQYGVNNIRIVRELVEEDAVQCLQHKENEPWMPVVREEENGVGKGAKQVNHSV